MKEFFKAVLFGGCLICAVKGSEEEIIKPKAVRVPSGLTRQDFPTPEVSCIYARGLSNIYYRDTVSILSQALYDAVVARSIASHATRNGSKVLFHAEEVAKIKTILRVSESKAFFIYEYRDLEELLFEVIQERKDLQKRRYLNFDWPEIKDLIDYFHLGRYVQRAWRASLGFQVAANP